MIPFLLTISFLLHIITMFAIFQLLKQQQTNQKDSNSEGIMEVMEVYLEEIKEENNRLEKIIKKENANKQYDTETKKEKQTPAAPENEKDTFQNQEEKQIETLLENSPQDEMNASLESRVLQLHMEGKNIEEIAKELNCGKTEAELIIKLYQKT